MIGCFELEACVCPVCQEEGHRRGDEFHASCVALHRSREVVLLAVAVPKHPPLLRFIPRNGCVDNLKGWMKRL